MSRLQTLCAESKLLRRARRDLPPGGRHPSLLLTLAARFDPYAYFEQCHKRLGDRFTLYPLGHPPLVMLANPDDVEAITASDSCELHPGEGSRMIEPDPGRFLPERFLEGQPRPPTWLPWGSGRKHCLSREATCTTDRLGQP